ncbi:hypothetical protein ACFLYK_01545 [Candidatus Cloacimonadota bacterium]
MEKFNPTDYLLKIQKIKYKEAVIPILLVFSGFAINFINPYSFVKYLSLFGLLAFIFISLKYRVRKNIPPDEKNIILSPVYGIVSDLDSSTGTLTISKGFFTPADYRCASINEEGLFQIKKGTLTLFETKCFLAGKLIGILPLNAVILCKLPPEFNLETVIGGKLIAGETVIAVKKG